MEKDRESFKVCAEAKLHGVPCIAPRGRKRVSMEKLKSCR